MSQNNKVKAYIAAVVFSVMVGFSFLGIKICTRTADPLTILTHRYNFAFIAAIIWLLIARIKTPDLMSLKNKPKGLLFIASSTYIAFMILQTIGIRFATSIESSIIFAIVPIMAKIIAEIFLKEESGLLQNMFVCLTVVALIAMLIISTTNLTLNIPSMIILMFSSLSMAISNVVTRYVRTTYRPIEITVAISTLGFVVFNIITIVNGLRLGTLSQYFAPVHDKSFLIAAAYLGICCILFSAQLMSFMLAHMEAVKATIFGNVSTAISIVAGVVVLGEPLKAYHVICTLLIIIGVLGVSVCPAKIKKKS